MLQLCMDEFFKLPKAQKQWILRQPFLPSCEAGQLYDLTHGAAAFSHLLQERIMASGAAGNVLHAGVQPSPDRSVTLSQLREDVDGVLRSRHAETVNSG